MLQPYLGRVIKKHRKQMGLSQQYILDNCNDASLSLNTIRNIERGKTKNPRVHTIDRIACSLDMTRVQLLEKARELKSQEAIDAQSLVLSAPGGPMSSKAINYIERCDDAKIDEILNKGTAAASVVVAPVNGGASSFLNRVFRRASTLNECWVKIVHMDAHFVDGETYNKRDFFSFLFKKIGLPTSVIKDENLDADDLCDAFELWAISEWKAFMKVILIVDGLDQMFATAQTHSDAMALVGWMTHLRSAIAQGDEPFNNLVLFTAFTGKTWSAAHGSKFVHQALPLKLEKLNIKQIGTMFEVLAIDASYDDLNEVMELFHGHPLLTHLYAWSLREQKDPNESKKGALNIEGGYQAHWNRMKQELLFLLGTEANVARTLNTLADTSCLDSWCKSIAELDDNYQQGLRVIGLLDGEIGDPKICQFYFIAMEKEKQTQIKDEVAHA